MILDSRTSLLVLNVFVFVMKAVDLAKRFCDGAAPRIINGCLRTFVEKHSGGDGEAMSSLKFKLKR